MEKVFFVDRGDLDEVNKVLKNGGKVKMIHAAGGGDYNYVSAYIVVEVPDNKKQN